MVAPDKQTIEFNKIENKNIFAPRLVMMAAVL